MKEFKIQVPEGYEIDKENSTFECIKFKPKGLTYDDIVDKVCYRNRINEGWPEDKDLFKRVIALRIDPTICPTSNQMKRLRAINQLMTVAYYFNEIVDKDIKSKYYYIFCKNCAGIVEVHELLIECVDTGIVYFKTEKSAEKALRILGVETVKLAISV